MGISRWLQSISSETLENILVDILTADGMTYSGYINSVALAEDPETVMLTSRPPKEGIFVGKKLSKKEIVGFNFSVTPRANFGVHQIRITESQSDLQFLHAIHDEQKFVLKGAITSKEKFSDECLSYLKKLNSDLLLNEKVALILFRGTTFKCNVDSATLDNKVREFLGA